MERRALFAVLRRERRCTTVEKQKREDATTGRSSTPKEGE
jgi:hypothetical protein